MTVGLKQGCASLSDLSFVLTCNNGALSFGIIARSLQHDEGCYLPSFELDSSKDIATNLTEVLNCKDMAGVAQCVAEYGFGSLEEGITMLSKHANELTCLTKWGLHNHVFKLIITDIQSSKENTNPAHLLGSDFSDGDDEEGEEGGFLDSIVSSAVMTSGRRSATRRSSSILDDNSTDSNENVNPFESVIKQLEKELPRYYIHIPDNFNLTINKKRVSFNYWQRHLVGLMRFDQMICQDRSFTTLQDLQEPGGTHVRVRIFCGFDPIRAEDSSRQSTLSVYIYSRKSGRLIKQEADGRNMLNITSGGTGYCQGLTCIVDDVEGSIPLNPTKQDVAFSEKRNGEILGENLYAWTSGIISMYYRYQLNKYLNSRKTDLSEELSRYENIVRDQFSDYSSSPNGSIKSLASSDFTTLDGVVWRKQTCKIQRRDKIVATISAKIKEVTGKDTLFQLNGNKKSNQPKSAKKAKKVKRPAAPIPDEVQSAPKRAKLIQEELPVRRARLRNMEKSIYVENTESEDEIDEEDFVISGVEKVVSKRVSNNRVQAVQHPGQSSQHEHLVIQLDQANRLYQKQKHDYIELEKVKMNIENENKRMFEEIEFLHSQQQSPSQNKENSEEYDLLLEVKNNLESENDRLNEEVDFLSAKYAEDHKKMQAEIEYLTEKQKSMGRKLEAERTLRMTAEQELEALEKNMRVQRG